MSSLIKEKNFHTARGYQLLNEENNLLTPSMEDYVEMIYRMNLNEEYIRMNQLAKKLNVRPSSTTKTVQKLETLGIVDYQKYGVVKLTDVGKEVGAFLLKRHMTIEKFLGKMGVEETLLKDTEMIEHGISLNALKNIDLLNDFLDHNPEILDLYEKYKKQEQD